MVMPWSASDELESSPSEPLSEPQADQRGGQDEREEQDREASETS